MIFLQMEKRSRDTIENRVAKYVKSYMPISASPDATFLKKKRAMSEIWALKVDKEWAAQNEITERELGSTVVSRQNAQRYARQVARAKAFLEYCDFGKRHAQDPTHEKLKSLYKTRGWNENEDLKKVFQFFSLSIFQRKYVIFTKQKFKRNFQVH